MFWKACVVWISPNMLPNRMPRNRQEVQTTSLDTMEKGMRAWSPFRLFQSAQTMRVPAKPQKSPITVALSHAYLHCVSQVSIH